MTDGPLPARAHRISTTVADGRDAPVDPVGIAVAEFLVELLDGIVVELCYLPPGSVHDDVASELAGTATARRDGPGAWRTTMIVDIDGGAAELCGSDGPSPRLPPILADLPEAAFRAADAIGRRSGLDGSQITAPMQRALQESVVIEIVAGQLARLSDGALRAADLRGVVTDTMAELERIAATTVEGDELSLGVVMRPAVADARTDHRFPDAFRQKRVPLLFDGHSSVLVIDAAGHVEREIQRARLDRALDASELDAASDFVERFGDLDGSLVASVSRAYGALGFYARPDHSIWICAAGPPLMVKRTGHWRAVPTEALAEGVSRYIGEGPTAALVVETAVLLSLHGHGGILAVAGPADPVDQLVQPKDRIDTVRSGTAESPVHDTLDVGDLDTATLLRLASIDGACVLDRSGRLLAYGAVVTSRDSEGEGARTAAARSLSRHLDVVVKVSEDGPITVFRDGEETGRLLD